MLVYSLDRRNFTQNETGYVLCYWFSSQLRGLTVRAVTSIYIYWRGRMTLSV